MRIAIATTGRFHVLDLARELCALGHEVAFYTIVPRARTAKFGLPPASHRSLLVWLLPFVGLQRIAGNRFQGVFDQLLLFLVDHLIAWKLEPCDVFIGMSGLSIACANKARARYGAKVYIERGSRHILSQKQILQELLEKVTTVEQVPAYAVRRELASYSLADTVVVPSQHALDSFTELGFRTEKLFRNPYGVDLAMFHPTTLKEKGRSTLIYVGTWSYQKGVDLLVEALSTIRDVDLLHIGAIGDAPFPQSANFKHVEPVPQWNLRDYYAQAEVFVLASRQDGYGLVLAQALACGLPLVCSDRTGGTDLRELLSDTPWISVFPHWDSEALRRAIQEMIPRAKELHGRRDLLEHSRDSLSWKAYALRYDQHIRSQSSGNMITHG